MILSIHATSLSWGYALRRCFDNQTCLLGKSSRKHCSILILCCGSLNVFPCTARNRRAGAATRGLQPGLHDSTAEDDQCLPCPEKHREMVTPDGDTTAALCLSCSEDTLIFPTESLEHLQRFGCKNGLRRLLHHLQWPMGPTQNFRGPESIPGASAVCP